MLAQCDGASCAKPGALRIMVCVLRQNKNAASLYTHTYAPCTITLEA